jgi:hypothetical protein
MTLLAPSIVSVFFSITCARAVIVTTQHGGQRGYL